MLTLEPHDRGPQRPMQSSPVRRPRSVRRTSTIDTSWPAGFDADVVMRCRVRDLLTLHGDGRSRSEVSVTLRLSPTREILEVAASGTAVDLAPLVGATVGPGFRRTIATAHPQLPAGGAVHLVLDDLPGAGLVSGYAMLASGVDMGSGEPTAMDARADLCSGWVRDGVFLSAVRDTGRIPTPIGPPSGTLQDADDPLSWHDFGAMVPVSTRRCRLIDVSVDEADPTTVRVETLFRDSHGDEHGRETSFHEYSLVALVRRDDGMVLGVSATPHVLPWTECPSAAASVGRVVGIRIDEVSELVRSSFRGPATCTHLNDTLRHLADVEDLLAQLEGSVGPEPPFAD